MTVTTAKLEIKTPFYVEKIDESIKYLKSYLDSLFKEREIEKDYKHKIFWWLMTTAAEQERKLSKVYEKKLEGKIGSDRSFWKKAGMKYSTGGAVSLSHEFKNGLHKSIERTTDKKLFSDTSKEIVNEFENAFLSTLVGERKRFLEPVRGHVYPKRRYERDTISIWNSRAWDFKND